MKKRELDHYLTKEQLEYFKGKLLNWKAEIMIAGSSGRKNLQEHHSEVENLDRANDIAEKHLELRTQERERKLIKKIEQAIARIDDGTYGYCEETGEPIGLKRLEARPIATLCIEAQERHEKMEKEYKDDAK